MSIGWEYTERFAVMRCHEDESGCLPGIIHEPKIFASVDCSVLKVIVPLGIIHSSMLIAR
jgi:hypothetical protein